MKCLFLDTVGLIALWDRSDQWHEAATQAYAEFHSHGPVPVAVTDTVLLECGNAASRRPYRSEVVAFRRQMQLDGGLIETTVEDHAYAWLEYQQGIQGKASIVDCISFAVMRRLDIHEAFTNDRHFQAAGFHILF